MDSEILETVVRHEIAERHEPTLKEMSRDSNELRRTRGPTGRTEVPREGSELTIKQEEIEAIRKQRDLRRERAANSRYSLTRYPRLRTGADYGEVSSMQTNRRAHTMLEWQPGALKRTLTVLPRHLENDALKVHKSLLGYTGEKEVMSPETLARDILSAGFVKRQLRDEVYLQIMKQITNNPSPGGVAKGWQVMSMVCKTFLPSRDLVIYTLNFMLRKCQNDGPEGRYAKYCLHTLEGIMSWGPSDLRVLTLDKIACYRKRPPFLATIGLVDGLQLLQDLPVSPDVTVKEILKICARCWGLQTASAEMMGLFVDVFESTSRGTDGTSTSSPAPATSSPLHANDYMGDVFMSKSRQGRAYKFVYKRKIFLPSQAWPDVDPAFNHLVYLQARDEVIRSGILQIPDKKSVELLATIALARDLRKHVAPTRGQMIAGEVARYIPRAWLQVAEAAVWTRVMEQLLPDFILKGIEELEILFVKCFGDSRMFGSHFFHISKVRCVPDVLSHLPTDLLLAFNAKGVHLLSTEKVALRHQHYSDIYSSKRTRDQLRLTMRDRNTDAPFDFVLQSPQASDISKLMRDYIDAVKARSNHAQR